MNLYAKYLKEREGKELIYRDWGFITYLINGDECYIGELYIHPDDRSLKRARELANTVYEIAKDGGCKFLTAGVDLKGYKPNEILKTFQYWGFEVISAKDDYMCLKKDIE